MPTASQEAPATLAEALLDFQSEVVRVSKNEEADVGKYSYKYLSLDKLLEEVLPKLTARGLHWFTSPSVLEGDKMTPALYWRLTHVPSQEEMHGKMPLMLVKGNPQDLGGAITYARRYALVTVLNIGQPDEDGAVSTSQGGGSQQGVRRITEAKAKQLVEEAGNLPEGDRSNLQLAATHYRGGEDVGDCSSDEAAVKALRTLSQGEGEKLAKWIANKRKAAVEGEAE